MNLVVVGTGYVGLVSGLCYAKLGHKVACVDIDPVKIAHLDLGEAPFYEPGLQELLRDMQEAGRIVFTTDIADVISDAQMIILAVGTPPGRYGEADLSYLFAAGDRIGELLTQEALVVTKSTVPVGTGIRLRERIIASLRARGREDLTSLVRTASLPEFLREGSAIADFLVPERVVIGADDEVVHLVLDRLHEGIDAPRLHMSIESAELTKYAANAFLATKISFINEIAAIAERTGADVRDVAHAIGMDSRIGPKFLRAGIGYGGSCFPKDVSALSELAGRIGYDFKLLKSVIEVNNRQRELFVQKIEDTLGMLKGRRFGVWGLAFKEGTDDVRDSAAVDIIGRLIAKGAEVCAYDPQATKNARRVLPESVLFASTAIDAANGAEALLVLTEWPQFRSASISTLRNVMIEPRIFDGRNLLNAIDYQREGFDYYGMGFAFDR